MAIREICLEGAPVLLQTAAKVTAFDAELADLVRDMFETMYAAPGRGLAAPQVGVPQRVFVVDTEWKDAEPAPMIFVNPVIADAAAASVTDAEACLSIPAQSFAVKRPEWIDVQWQDLDGTRQEGRFSGVQARCICHELDHLNGLLITQTGRPI